jgi:hypothetical protein
MSLPLIIGIAAGVELVGLLFFIALARSSKSGSVTAVRDESEDFDWSWPPSTTDCTGGAPASRSAASKGNPHA